MFPANSEIGREPNLGPTGARATLESKSFTVKYIFEGTPAAGKLQLDDVITTACPFSWSGMAVENHRHANAALIPTYHKSWRTAPIAPPTSNR